MAVNVNIIGRLGADSEIKTNSNGRPFVVFRLATDEFKNGKAETTWLNVADYTEKTHKMAAYLKKGSLVNIHGIETIGTYKNKNGETTFSRDVISDRVDFVNSGTSGSTASTKQDETSEMSCGTLKNPSAQTAEPVLNGVVDSSSDDDLPF